MTDAYRGIPASTAGPFPLVLFSHGFASYRQQSSFLMTHLASWGFVVISPDYLERGLKSVLGEPPADPRPDTEVADEAINAMKAANDHSRWPARRCRRHHQDLSDRPLGRRWHHAAAPEQAGCPSGITLASGVSLLSLVQGNAPVLPADKPIMWMGARDDNVANIADIRTGFQYTPAQTKLVELSRSGHNTFDDICKIGGGGGVSRWPSNSASRSPISSSPSEATDASHPPTGK